MNRTLDTAISVMWERNDRRPAPERSIRVTYSSIDRFRKVRKFKTLAGAKKFAHYWIGAHPELGLTYAVSGDGIGKITVEGASLSELFPERGE